MNEWAVIVMRVGIWVFAGVAALMMWDAGTRRRRRRARVSETGDYCDVAIDSNSVFVRETLSRLLTGTKTESGALVRTLPFESGGQYDVILWDARRSSESPATSGTVRLIKVAFEPDLRVMDAAESERWGHGRTALFQMLRLREDEEPSALQRVILYFIAALAVGMIALLVVVFVREL